jgi:hypothetical protein
MLITGRASRRVAKGDDGYVLMTAVLLLSVMAVMAAAMFTISNHLGVTTNADRTRKSALSVAESGAEVAIASVPGLAATLTNGQTVTGTGTTADGSYSYTLTKSGDTYLVTSRGVVGTGTGESGAARVLQVTLSAPSSFSVGLFSNSNVDLSDNQDLYGDLWSNQSIVLRDNQHIHSGSVIAVGYVSLAANTTVDNDVWTGGYDSSGQAVSGTGLVRGNVKASPSTCTAGSYDTGNYDVVGVRVTGTITTAGNLVNVSGAHGTISTGVCTAAPAPKAMPSFAWNAADYPSPLWDSAQEMTRAQFQTWVNANRSNLKGAFRVTTGGDSTHWIDMSGGTVTGNFLVMSETAPIYVGDGGLNFSSTDKVVVLGSLFTPPAGKTCNSVENAQFDGSTGCAVGIKEHTHNNAQSPTVIYAPNAGVAIKDDVDLTGTLYVNGARLGNNVTVRYDSRVDHLAGFGSASLVQTKWVELPNG